MPGTADPKFMLEAIRLATENVRSGGGGPFGAVIVMGGEIVAAGVNQVTAANDPTAHAEVNAIRAACQALNTFELRSCELYTSCEPCPMCLSAIYWARLEMVYYGNTSEDAANSGFDDSSIYNEIRMPNYQRQISMIRLLGDRAIESFTAWRHHEGKIEY